MRVLWYLSWFPLAIVAVVVGLLAYPLVPIAVLLRKNEKLPWYFWWLETYDNPIYGEPSHIRRWQQFVSAHPLIGPYVQRVAWLWRNKAYNFDYWICGRDYGAPFRLWGNPHTESGYPSAVPGYVFITTPKTWCLFAFLPLLTIGSYRYYLRLYLGWKTKKLGTYPTANEHAMLASHINPFRRIKIK